MHCPGGGKPAAAAKYPGKYYADKKEENEKSIYMAGFISRRQLNYTAVVVVFGAVHGLPMFSLFCHYMMP